MISGMTTPFRSNALYQIAAIRELERLAIEKYNLPEATLMENAGQAVFQALRDRWPDAKQIWVFCGKGNNGGDGYVVARLAAEQGLSVQVRHLGQTDNLSSVAMAATHACQHAGGHIQPYDAAEAVEADVIVDALLGIGLQGEVRAEYAEVIHTINQARLPVVAIDTPSGIDAETGQVLGSAVRAQLTVTFIGLKSGLLTGAAKNYCGEILCDRLELPDAAFKKVAPSADCLSTDEITAALPPRASAANKGDFGHVLVIGGVVSGIPIMDFQ